MIPERYTDEWFDVLDSWISKHWHMLTEYNLWVEYRDGQNRLMEYSREVQDRIAADA